MNTIRGVARHTVSSPLRLATAVGALLLVLGAVVGSWWTDNSRLAGTLFTLVCLLFGVIFYLQPDCAVGIAERYQPEVMWRIPTKELRAALTIDDVPLLDRPTHLEEILDVLLKHKVRATLFVMSGFTLDPEKGGMEPGAGARCRALLKRAVAEGHELGNHLQFDKPAIAMPPEEFDEAFLHCDALLAELAAGGEAGWRARPRRWFRPASALWSGHMLAAARRKGYSTVIANCYPHDVAAATRHSHAPYLRRRARPGAVIVVHDRWHTPETLKKALPQILASGLQLGTLSELQAVADKEAVLDFSSEDKLAVEQAILGRTQNESE